MQNVILRTMTPAEYRAATEHREAESVRVLSRLMPEEQARERVAQGTTSYLPDGVDTSGHHLVTAENEAGEPVGNAWIGPAPTRSSAASNTSTVALLYDINVFEPFRRHGYGTAILAAAEKLIAAEGMTALTLNVVGDNEAAIALYRRSGYEVTAMSMRKEIKEP